MPVIARDAVASDHLVYAWPFPIGPEEHDVVCADDEQVVMCPAWLVGNLLQVGRHRWRTPDPTRPVHAFFVLTAPVEVSFDMVTMFIVPTTGEGVRLRATGSLQVRCTDPALLIAQFVGLPFDLVNEGILRSVSRSIERMLARLLTRRVIMAGTAQAVTDMQMHSHIVEELVAYNPAAGAVFGVELVRMGHLAILADDGSRPLAGTNGSRATPLTETVRGTHARPTPVLASPQDDRDDAAENRRRITAKTLPPPITPVDVEAPAVPASKSARASSQPSQQTSGEIVVKPRASAPSPTPLPERLPEGTPLPASRTRATVQGFAALGADLAEDAAEISKGANDLKDANGSNPVPLPRPPAQPRSIEIPQSTDEITQPGVQTPLPGARRLGSSDPVGSIQDGPERGAIMGIGMSPIGAAVGVGTGSSSSASASVAAGEIVRKIAPGVRVLVPGPNGLMQAATVRQLLQGYYELEVGASGETIWVPINGVVPHE
jgi:hypothetical protein